MIFGIADDGHANAQAIRNGPFGYRIGGVVGALGVNIGAQDFQKCLNIRFTEQNNVVDGTQRSDQLRAGVFVKDWAAGTF